jgi:hypothetical protein
MRSGELRLFNVWNKGDSLKTKSRKSLLHHLKKIRRIDTAIVAISILAAIGFWTRNLLIIALLIPAGIYVIKHKAATKEEQERRQALSLKSFAVSLIVPILIVFSLIVFLLIRLIPLIIENWQM